MTKKGLEGEEGASGSRKRRAEGELEGTLSEAGSSVDGEGGFGGDCKPSKWPAAEGRLLPGECLGGAVVERRLCKFADIIVSDWRLIHR